MRGEQTVRRKCKWYKLNEELIRRKRNAQKHPATVVLTDSEIKNITGSTDLSNPLQIDNGYDKKLCIRSWAAEAGFDVDYKSEQEKGIKVFTEIITSGNSERFDVV